jgi:hypothetical protein
MAGIKISALPEGTVLADNDLIPYVDVSDTSEAATGTTKFMLKSLLAIPAVNVESGTYNPNPSAVSGLTSVTGVSGKYTVIDDIVTGGFYVTTVLSGASASYTFRLPVSPSASFADGKKVVVTLGCKTPTDEWTEYAVQSEAASDNCIVNIVAAGTVTIEMYIMFTYSITQ